MRVDIVPATLRDMTYIAANMREADRREVMATADLPSVYEAALMCFAGSEGWRWVANYRGTPAAAFGVAEVSPLQPHMRSAWAWGTKNFIRIAAGMTRFCQREWPARLIAEGVTRVEIRSIVDHDLAHGWLAALRARRECDLVNYGVNGETFTLWSWIKEDWDDV